MGYMTEYSLQVSCVDAYGCRDQDKESRIEDAAQKAFSDELIEECTLYDHEEVLKAFSVSHPDALFILTMFGEKQPDIWRLYVMNGKSHQVKARIIFEAFDKTKLV